MSILEAATYVFCREGFAGANIDMIAAEAGVSRQTIYNHHGDKEKLFVAVVQALTERANAGFFATLATFPDHPADLEADLVAFAVRLNRNCICNSDGQIPAQADPGGRRALSRTLRRLARGRPGKTWAALAARFARLAHAGYLEIDDPDVAARQFLALINADLHISMMLGDRPDDERVRAGRDQRGANLPARLRQARSSSASARQSLAAGLLPANSPAARRFL